MPWTEIDLDKLADELGVNIAEIREKNRLIRMIIKARKDQKVSQAKLAKKLGVTQGRIAQIESGIGAARVSFDVLLNTLQVLGYEYKVIAKKAG